MFEDLGKLRENGNGGKRLSWMKSLWCYGRIQEYAEYKALIEGIKTVYVNPAKTSRRAPNGKKLRFINYKFVELGEVVTTRDVVALTTYLFTILYFPYFNFLPFKTLKFLSNISLSVFSPMMYLVLLSDRHQ